MKKYIYKILVLTFVFSAFCGSAFAASLKIDTEKATYDIGEEFYIDLVADTAGQSINGVEGIIDFNRQTLEFLRAENGLSFITYWIENPILNKENKIVFSGITPAGFSGILNNGEELNLGVVTRLVFRPISSGNSLVSVSNFNFTINDGEGTQNNIPASSVLITVTNKNNPSSYNKEDYVKPELTAEIIKDENLGEGVVALAFNAIDKDSGVEGVYLKSKNGEWVKIQNPYIINKENAAGLLVVKAVDYSGNEVTKRFVLPGFVPGWAYLILVILVILSIYAGRFLYKVYGKKY